MGRGRPPKRLGHVDALSGDETAKARMKAIFETVAGDLSVVEACGRLGVSETRFFELRQQALDGMLEGLAPRPVGRPPKEPEEDEDVTRLKAQMAWLEEELEVSRTRTIIALVNPDLLRDPVVLSPEKKGSSAKTTSRFSPPRRDGRSGT